jgi:ABC-2 type transport system permease protein
MPEIFVVMRRELRSYFLSPIAYVFGGLFLGVLGYLSRSAFQQGMPTTISLSRFFSMFPSVFLFFLPALSMRLWAEERKLGTLELLLTYPVRLWGLILGKFFAALAFLGVLLLLSTALPILLSFYGSVDWGPVCTAYLASFLMAGAYISVGMFWSSMTRDQIIAMLASLVTLLLLFLLASDPVLLQLPRWLAPVVGAIGPQRYFSSITRGVVDTRDLVYYVCFCGFFLYLNLLVLQAKRRNG